MGEARKYTSGTHATLMSLCRGYCYWPGCEEPVTRFVDGEHILNLEIAHIRAVSSGGKRFDPKLSLDEKNAFSNLLLLCKVHHVRVDGHGSEQYTVELLEVWKERRESEGTAPLLELRGLTEARRRPQPLFRALTVKGGLRCYPAERGARMRPGSLNEQFQLLAEQAGVPYIDGKKVTSHSWRARTRTWPRRASRLPNATRPADGRTAPTPPTRSTTVATVLA
ncbi:hypothetical protein [Streptomyces sp. bgisy091]|uniref:hypothetical protein n=1 Tax=Streptomyces sp. bgisy091 TaxID=3413778 RepID=UPI003D725D3D